MNDGPYCCAGTVLTVSCADAITGRPVSLSMELLTALRSALDGIARLAGVAGGGHRRRGQAFCAGTTCEMRAHPKSRSCRRCSRRWRGVMTMQRMPRLRSSPASRVATAAGCQLVAACDLAVAARCRPLHASGSTSVCSARRRAWRCRNGGQEGGEEMLLTGSLIDAQTRSLRPLVNQVVPPTGSTTRWRHGRNDRRKKSRRSPSAWANAHSCEQLEMEWMRPISWRRNRWPAT